MFLNLNLTYKTQHWDRMWLVDLNVGKTQLVSFDRCNNIVAIDVKMDGSVRVEKLSVKMLGLTFSLKWIGAHALSLLLKLLPRKLES